MQLSITSLRALFRRCQLVANCLRVMLLAISTCMLPGCSGCSSTLKPEASPEISTVDSANAEKGISIPAAGDVAVNSSDTNTVQRFSGANSLASDELADEGDIQYSSDIDSTSAGVSIPANHSAQPPKRKPAPDATAVVKSVEQLMEKSRQAKGRKDYGKAFELATQAWEAARLHPRDRRVQDLSVELSTELDALSELANTKFNHRVRDPSTVLIDK